VVWTEPIVNGSPITSYRILIRESDLLTYTELRSSCDGSASGIISALRCLIPLTELSSEPFNLAFGDSVFSRIIAVNYYGESVASEGGNGAIIVTVPTPPINLIDNVSVTSAFIIGLKWDAGYSSGGSPVLDYRITYD